MKRSFFYTALVLTTVCLATSSRTFGDSKVRIGGGGSGRGQVGSHNGPSASSVNARPRGLSGNNGHQNSGHQNSGNHSSHSHNGGSGNSGKGLGGFHVGNQGVKWPQASNGHADSHGDSGKPIIKFPGQSGHGQSGHGQPGHGGRPNFNAPLPPNLHNKIGHTIPGLNGTKLKPVGINVDHILKHHGPSNHAQPQIQNIVASAPKHLSSHQHFSWWVSTCHSHCHTNYGCWNTNSSYWDCWTPCNWQVVQCEQFSFYVGLGCVHIPDMQAYGVQTVVNGSPAQLAGLVPGDLILAVNGQTAIDPNLVNREVNRGRLDLQVMRNGSPLALQLVVFPRLVQNVSF